jgi:AhpD family alkylhydroperoxidase
MKNLSRAGTCLQLNGAHADHAATETVRKSVTVRGEEFSKFLVPDVTAARAVSSCVHPADKDGTSKENDMKPRLDLFKAAPGPIKAMLGLQDHVNNSGLEQSLQELVKTRASQINGCAFCLHMHTRDARAAGETEERLYLLNAWRESPLYTERERAALAYTEALTRLSETANVPDDVYNDLKASFTEDEMVELTLAINAINSWNRFNVAFRTVHPVKARAIAAA